MLRAYEATHLTQGQNTHIFRERKAKKTLSGPLRKQEQELQEEPKKITNQQQRLFAAAADVILCIEHQCAQ